MPLQRFDEIEACSFELPLQICGLNAGTMAFSFPPQAEVIRISS
jgi:hypothetical protein